MYKSLFCNALASKLSSHIQWPTKKWRSQKWRIFEKFLKFWKNMKKFIWVIQNLESKKLVIFATFDFLATSLWKRSRNWEMSIFGLVLVSIMSFHLARFDHDTLGIWYVTCRIFTFQKNWEILRGNLSMQYIFIVNLRDNGPDPLGLTDWTHQILPCFTSHVSKIV